MTLLEYDGSMAGFLTAVFEVYERKLENVHITTSLAGDMFANRISVDTDATKASRVWDGLKNKISKLGLSQLHYTFLSELPEREDQMLEYIRYAFAGPADMEQNFGYPAVLYVVQTARKVGREKHRMEAFIRFEILGDGLHYAGIEPDFNVLPLIVKHFRNRYAGQDWLIYDLRRRYGIFYDMHTGKAGEIMLDAKPPEPGALQSQIIVDVEEAKYQQLWKDYFKSANIPERKNMKLHLQHVPRRYWKYLTEKFI